VRQCVLLLAFVPSVVFGCYARSSSPATGVSIAWIFSTSCMHVADICRVLSCVSMREQVEIVHYVSVSVVGVGVGVGVGFGACLCFCCCCCSCFYWVGDVGSLSLLAWIWKRWSHSSSHVSTKLVMVCSWRNRRFVAGCAMYLLSASTISLCLATSMARYLCISHTYTHNTPTNTPRGHRRGRGHGREIQTQTQTQTQIRRRRRHRSRRRRRHRHRHKHRHRHRQRHTYKHVHTHSLHPRVGEPKKSEHICVCK